MSTCFNTRAFGGLKPPFGYFVVVSTTAVSQAVESHMVESQTIVESLVVVVVVSFEPFEHDAIVTAAAKIKIAVQSMGTI